MSNGQFAQEALTSFPLFVHLVSWWSFRQNGTESKEEPRRHEVHEEEKKEFFTPHFSIPRLKSGDLREGETESLASTELGVGL